MQGDFDLYDEDDDSSELYDNDSNSDDGELDYENEGRKSVKKTPRPTYKLDYKTQVDGRFVKKNNTWYVLANSGEEYIIASGGDRFQNLMGHDLLITIIINDTREKPPIIKVLSYI